MPQWCVDKAKFPNLEVLSACVFFKRPLRLSATQINRYKVPKLKTLIQEHTGWAQDNRNKPFLIARLNQLEDAKREQAITNAMDDEPMYRGVALTRPKMVHTKWFKNQDQADEAMEELEGLVI